MKRIIFLLGLLLPSLSYGAVYQNYYVTQAVPAISATGAVVVVNMIKTNQIYATNVVSGGTLRSGVLATNGVTGQILQDNGTFAAWVNPTNVSGVGATNVYQSAFSDKFSTVTNGFLYQIDLIDIPFGIGRSVVNASDIGDSFLGVAAGPAVEATQLSTNTVKTLLGITNIAAYQSSIAPTALPRWIIYASRTNVPLDGSLTANTGTDATAYIQRILDLVTNGIYLEYHHDGVSRLASPLTPLIIRSNTSFICDSPTYGLFRANSNNCEMIKTGIGTNAGIYANIEISGGTWNGNMANQNINQYDGGDGINTCGSGSSGLTNLFVFFARFSGVDNLRLNNMHIIDGGVWQLVVNDSKNIWLNNLWYSIVNWQPNGVYQCGSDPMHFLGVIENLYIANLRVENSFDDVIALNLSDAAHWTQDNTFSRNRAYATNIVIDGVVATTTNVSISYNSIRVQGGDWGTNCPNAMVQNLSIRNCQFYGSSSTIAGGPSDLVNIDNCVWVLHSQTSSLTSFGDTSGGRWSINNVIVRGRTNTTVRFLSTPIVSGFVGVDCKPGSGFPAGNGNMLINGTNIITGPLIANGFLVTNIPPFNLVATNTGSATHVYHKLTAATGYWAADTSTGFDPNSPTNYTARTVVATNFQGNAFNATNIPPQNLRATNAGVAGYSYHWVTGTNGYWAPDSTNSGGGGTITNAWAVTGTNAVILTGFTGCASNLNNTVLVYAPINDTWITPGYPDTGVNGHGNPVYIQSHDTIIVRPNGDLDTDSNIIIYTNNALTSVEGTYPIQTDLAGCGSSNSITVTYFPSSLIQSDPYYNTVHVRDTLTTSNLVVNGSVNVSTIVATNLILINSNNNYFRLTLDNATNIVLEPYTP